MREGNTNRWGKEHESSREFSITFQTTWNMHTRTPLGLASRKTVVAWDHGSKQPEAGSPYPYSMRDLFPHSPTRGIKRIKHPLPRLLVWFMIVFFVLNLSGLRLGNQAAEREGENA